MIDYEKIKDPEYFKDTLSDIREINDVATLTNLLKILSIKIANKQVEPVEANMLLSTIKSRIKVLTDARKQSRANGGDGNGGRQMIISPTAVSGKAGTATVVLILVNVAITTVMYTLLWIAHIIK